MCFGHTSNTILIIYYIMQLEVLAESVSQFNYLRYYIIISLNYYENLYYKAIITDKLNFRSYIVTGKKTNTPSKYKT